MVRVLSVGVILAASTAICETDVSFARGRRPVRPPAHGCQAWRPFSLQPRLEGAAGELCLPRQSPYHGKQWGRSRSLEQFEHGDQHTALGDHQGYQKADQPLDQLDL